MDESISQLQQASVINLSDLIAIAQEGVSSSKKASLDQIRSVFGALGVSGIASEIPDTTFVPPASPSGTIVYFMGPGTYPDFPTGSGDLILTEALNAVTWNGTVANALAIPVGVDLSGYVQKSGVQDTLSSISIDQPLSANQGRVLNERLDTIASIGFTFIEVSNTSGPAIGWRNEILEFSGWAINAPAQPAFNAVKIKFRSWDAANPIQNIRVIVRDGGSAGAILGDKTVAYSAAVGVESDVEFVFDNEINTGLPVWVAYMTDGHCGIYGPNSGFVDTKNTTAQDLVTEPSGGFSKYGALVIFQQADEVAEPTQDFSDKVIENSPQLAGTINTVNSAITSIPGESTPIDSFPEVTAAFQDTTSTFTGWGTPIGAPTSINKVRFRIRGKSGNAGDITKIRCWITEVDINGAILADKTITGLAISALQDAYIDVILDSTIENTAGGELYFAFACDEKVDAYGALGTVAYDSPPYGHSGYTTASNPDLLSPSDFIGSSSIQRNIWVETSFEGNIPVPTDLFVQEVEKKLPGSSLDGIISAEIVLPSRIYAVEGTELNIYWDNIVHSNYPLDGLHIDATCSKGQQFDRYWRYTPEASDAGSTSLTIAVKHGDKVIASASATVYTVALTSGNGVARSVIAVGDSTTDQGEWLDVVAAEHSADVMAITFKGTQGSAPTLNEGRGGYTVHDYATEGRTLYRFDVSGVMVAPSIGATYDDGSGSVYVIREVNITGSAGYVGGQLSSGSGTPAATGMLTKVSGGGDAAISYSATSFISGNPFWNGTTLDLDFAGYLTDNSISLTSGDWIAFHLGINDVFGLSSDAAVDAKVTTMISELRGLIANMRSAVPGLRVTIGVTIPPSGSQDAFGTNYGNGQTMERYRRNNKIWAQKLIEEFDNDTERSAGNYLLPFNSSIDRIYNFPHNTQNVNARSTDQITFWNNGVHPAQSGYDQMGDVLFSFLKNLL